ncbi:MAG: GNAT family N-acetyltransferase [Candidatus Zixiibacteriota bacterium]
MIIEFFRKLWRFGKTVAGHVLNGEFALGVHAISGVLPRWLLRFNKGTLLYTGHFEFSGRLNPDIRTKLADSSDIDEINRISGVRKDHIRQMMASGAVCYMGRLEDGSFSSIAWSAFNKCFVRGLGYARDFGPTGHYTFGLYTLPETRKKGLNMALFSESVKHANAKGFSDLFSIVEFTNRYALNFHLKCGYRPLSQITYLKIFCLRLTADYDILAGKSSLKLFLREPRGDVTVI